MDCPPCPCSSTETRCSVDRDRWVAPPVVCIWPCYSGFFSFLNAKKILCLAKFCQKNAYLCLLSDLNHVWGINYQGKCFLCFSPECWVRLVRKGGLCFDRASSWGFLAVRARQLPASLLVTGTGKKGDTPVTADKTQIQGASGKRVLRTPELSTVWAEHWLFKRSWVHLSDQIWGPSGQEGGNTSRASLFLCAADSSPSSVDA